MLQNICEYTYIIDQNTAALGNTLQPNSTTAGNFLPKLQTSGNKAGEYTLMKQRMNGGMIGGGIATSAGPLYKKRGYASSQLDVRREASHQAQLRAGSGGPNNQLAAFNTSGYEKTTSLYQGERDLGANTGMFHIEIFKTKKG